MRSRETDSRPLASFEGEAAGALAALSLSPARPASAPLESQPLIVVPIPAPIHLATITRGPWDAAKPPLFAMPPDSMHSGAEPPGFLPSDAASLATPALPVTAVEPPRTPPKAPRRASEGSSLVESVAPPGPPLLSGIAARRRIGPLQQHAPLQETRITLPSPSRSFLPSAAPGPRSPWLNVRRAASDIGPLASPALSDRGYVETPNSEVIVASYFPAGSGSLSSVGMAESNGTMNMREHANGHDSKDDSPFPQPLPKLGDSELEAAEALGGLRNAVPSPRPGSTSPVLLPDTTMVTASDTSPKAGDFIARVANYPVVNSGIQQISRMYEAGKESHAIVKLGAQTVESVGTSVIKKLEPALGPSLRSLDRFATNSLDRLEQYVPSFKPTGVAPIRDDEDPMRYQLTGAASTDTVVASASAVELPLPPPSPGLGRDEGGYGGTQPLVQRKPRSTWSTIVSNVGGYVISEETMRGLRYCLQWLQYATQLIDSRIQLLKSYLARLVPGSPGSAISNERTTTIVAGVKKDVVETLRNVVDVVGRYAAVVLPTESRDNVRAFVLSLPSRFSRLSAPGSSDEAQTVLAFASESRTMLGGVETVFRQSFERAESVLNKIGLSTPNSNGIPTVMLESGAGPAVNGVVPVPASMSNDDAMEVDA